MSWRKDAYKENLPAAAIQKVLLRHNDDAMLCFVLFCLDINMVEFLDWGIRSRVRELEEREKAEALALWNTRWLTEEDTEWEQGANKAEGQDNDGGNTNHSLFSFSLFILSFLSLFSFIFTTYFIHFWLILMVKSERKGDMFRRKQRARHHHTSKQTNNSSLKGKRLPLLCVGDVLTSSSSPYSHLQNAFHFFFFTFFTFFTFFFTFFFFFFFFFTLFFTSFTVLTVSSSL